MTKSKINDIIFDYKSHDEIMIKINYQDKEGHNINVVSNVVMKIEEDKGKKYFENSNLTEAGGLVNNYKSVYYYDRITATLETDPIRKSALSKIFNKNEDAKNALFIADSEGIVAFENVDTKDIKFQIANKTPLKKFNIDNFQEIFFSSKIKDSHLDMITALRFSIVSNAYAKEAIEKISKNMANTLIREYPNAFEEKVTLNNSSEITGLLSKYLIDKYMTGESNIENSNIINFDEVFEKDKKTNKFFESHVQVVQSLCDAKALRNVRVFNKVLSSNEFQEISKVNIPLQEYAEKIKRVRFDTMLLNQHNPKEGLNELAESFRINKFGNLLIQDNQNDFVSKNTYTLEVDKNNLYLSLAASLKDSSKNINKILDLRKITEKEQKEKIFEMIFSNQVENMTVLVSEKSDAVFLETKTKNGNFYKMDGRFLGENDKEDVYIADIIETAYSYDLNYKEVPISHVAYFEKKLIAFPKYDEEENHIKNIANAKSLFVDKVIKQKDLPSAEQALSGKIDSIYKYEKLSENTQEFSLTNVNKDYSKLRKSEELYEFAKGNVGKFFKNNLETMFSSFNVSKDKKIFNNDFYYNSNSSFSISSLEKSIALASHVSRMPTGNIISKIAKKFNIHIDAEKPFSLSDTEQNKSNIGKKDFVTSSKLGAMKFSYLPKTFELKSKDKEILIDIVKDILKRNPSITKDILERELKSFSEMLGKSSLMALKNEQSVIDVSKFAPKEVLVLIDENLKDISKVNISIAEFYSELEKREIFDIKDYVEITKVNSISIEKITLGLSHMIQEFKKEQLAFSGLDAESIDSKLREKNIELKGNHYSPIEILISNANPEYKDKKFYDLGKEVNIIDFYQTFLKFETTDKLIDWVQKQKLNEPQLLALDTLLKDKFQNNEVPMIEQKSAELFLYINRILGEDNDEVYKKLEDKIYKLYHDKKSESNVVSKTMKLYAVETFMKDALKDLQSISKDLTKQEQIVARTKVYTQMKRILDVTALEVMSLSEPQYQEALNFAVLKSYGAKDTQMLFWEMRQGKTRAAFASKLFSSFIDSNKNIQRNIMFVQNKNLEDIAQQVVDFFPILAKDVIFNSNQEISLFRNNKVLSLPVNISKQITPQVIQMLKGVIKYQGHKNTLKSDSTVLSNTYTKDMNKIYKQFINFNYDDLVVKFKDSPFIDVLKLTNMKKADKEISASIMQTFLYIQTIYERKYLSPTDTDVVFEKAKSFVLEYIEAKEYLKNNKLSKFGIDLVPKNVLYSINVDSPITNVVIEKANEQIKVGKGFISTPYEIEADILGEFSLVNIDSKITKGEFATVLENAFATPKGLREATEETKIFRITDTESDAIILQEKHAILESFVRLYLSDCSSDMQTILDAFIKKQITSTQLESSPIYRIDGLNEQYKDTIEVELAQILDLEKFSEFIKEYDVLNKKEIDEVIAVIDNKENLVEFAKSNNDKYYYDSLYKIYDTSLTTNMKKRLELVSPLVAKKYKELASSFSMDMEIRTGELIYPLRKSMEGKDKRYFYDIITLKNEVLDIDNLAILAKKELSGLQLELSYAQNLPQFTIKKEQKTELLLDAIVKRNENLSSRYSIDLKPDIANVTVDESHKGLKKASSSLNIHDTTSYLHKITKANNGSFTSVSGTPMSGMARDIGKIMTTGIDSVLSKGITKNIDAYCTTYEFRNNLDAMLFSAVDMFPDGHTIKAFTQMITVPEDKNVTLESLKLSEERIKGIREEVRQVVKLIPNLDKEERRELLNSKVTDASLVARFDYFKDIYNMEDKIGKLGEGKYIRQRENDVKTLLNMKIDLLAKKVAGINNFATLSDIVRKVSSSNSVNISRINENTAYNIMDLHILKKQTEARDIKHAVSGKLETFKDKTLCMSAYLENYKTKLKIGTVKEKINKIFESWILDMFSEDNYSKTVRFLGLDEKVGLKEIRGNEVNTFKINMLMSRSGRSVTDSSTDIFNTLYFGSEQEKYELSTNKELKEKVNFVISIMDKFTDFTKSYVDFQAKALMNLETKKMNAKDSKEITNVDFTYNGFVYNAVNYEDLSPDLEGVHIFEPLNKNEELQVVSLTNDGGVIMNGTPLVFKIELDVNKWENILNTPLKLKYSLTNNMESEIMEYLASPASELYKEHLNKNENIRIMSGRNANLVISLMDTIQALCERTDKERKAVLIFNKNSSQSYNFSQILDNINPETFKDNNIELKLTNSATFPSMLKSVEKNKNCQIAVVGNYIALAEGIDMSCIDTGFYVGSLKDGAETIQSFARQRSHQKNSSDIFLGGNGALERYKINVSASAKSYTTDNTPFRQIAKSLFRDTLLLNSTEIPASIKPLEQLHFTSGTSLIVLSTDATLAKLEAYEAVMSGNYPAQNHDYTKSNLISPSSYFIKKEQEKEKELANFHKIEKQENEEIIIEANIVQ